MVREELRLASVLERLREIRGVPLCSASQSFPVERKEQVVLRQETQLAATGQLKQALYATTSNCPTLN